MLPRLLSQFREPLDRLREVLAVADVRTKCADRPSRLHHVRASEIDGDVDVARDLRRQRALHAAPPASCIRIAPNPCARLS